MKKKFDSNLIFLVGSTLLNLQIMAQVTGNSGSSTYSPRSPPSSPSRDTEVRAAPIDLPPWVNATREDGVEEGSLVLAQAFYNAHRSLCHRTQKRGELSQLYLSTFNSWASEETKTNVSNQRQFKQVLYAMTRGLQVLRVVDQGRRLLWKANRPRLDERRDGGRRFDDRRDGGRHSLPIQR